jgi:hypothetical protein
MMSKHNNFVNIPSYLYHLIYRILVNESILLSNMFMKMDYS